MRTLRQQVEEIVGYPISVYTPEAIASHFGLSRNDFHKCTELNTRLVDIRRVVRGEDKPKRPLIFVISDFRGGFLVQLRELTREPSV